METFEFTRRKLARERMGRYRRTAIVGFSAMAAVAVGYVFPDSESVSGVLRTGILGSIAGCAAILLTR